MPPETVMKISRANRGKKRSPEVCAAQSKRMMGNKIGIGNAARLGKKLSKESRLKISLSLLGNKRCVGRVTKGMLGKKHSDATKRKLSKVQKVAQRKYWQTVPKEERIARTRAGLRAIPYQDTGLELAVQQCLRDLKVRFTAQKCLQRYRVDIYIAKWKLVIECDGYYWHSNPSARAHDRERDKQLLALGYRTVRVVEKKFKREGSAYLKRLLDCATNSTASN